MCRPKLRKGLSRDKQGNYFNCPTYLIALSLLFVSLLIVYSNSFRGTWILDDRANIVGNENVKMEHFSWKNLQKSFQGRSGQKGTIKRPLAYLSFTLNYFFGQSRVFGYHVVNFFIHFLAATFLFLLLLNILKLPILPDIYKENAYSIALLTAFIWAIHPIQVTAVTYIVQRMASMAALFFIMAMYFYLKGRRAPNRGKQIAFFSGCGVAAVCAFGSKENAAMLPVVLFVFDLLLIQGVTQANLIKNAKIAVFPVLGLILLGAAYTDLASLLGGYENRPFTLGERLLTESRVFFLYISLLLYPLFSRLTLLHDIPISESLASPWTTTPAVLALIGFFVLAVCLSRKRPLISFCLLFFLLNHVIEGSIIPLELVFEHRNYLPSTFFFLPLVLGLFAVLRYFSAKKFIPILMVFVAIFILVGFGHTVYRRNSLFQNPSLLYADTVRKSPNLSRPHLNLGVYLHRRGYDQRALQEYQKAKSLDRYLNRVNKVKTLNNLGLHYLNQKGSPRESIPYFRQALQINAQYRPSYYHLLQALLESKQIQKMAQLTKKTRQMWPNNLKLKYYQCLVFLMQAKYQECLNTALSAFKKKPTQAMYKILGEIFRRQGELAKAIHYWERAFAKNKSDTEAQSALFYLYARRGQDKKLNQFLGILDYKRGNQEWISFLAQNKEDRFEIFSFDVQQFLHLVKRYYQDLSDTLKQERKNS